MKDEYSCLFHHFYGSSVYKKTPTIPFGQSVLLYNLYCIHYNSYWTPTLKSHIPLNPVLTFMPVVDSPPMNSLVIPW